MATWKFSTANGPKEANEVLPIFIKELNTTTYPLRMGKCPDVLSVGLRAMFKNGDRWSFGWMFGFDPFVLLPRVMIIVLVVISDVPYLILGAPRCQPRPVADKEAQKSCGYSYINRSITFTVDVTRVRKRKRNHQTGPAMANEEETSGDDVPGMVDPDSDDDAPLNRLLEDTMPLDRLFNRGRDPNAEPSGALTAQTPVDRPADLDHVASDEVRDYGRP